MWMKRSDTMARLKDHVVKLTSQLAEHHRVIAECHGAACDDPGQSDAARQFHKMMAAHHAGMSDCMKGVHEECMKSSDDIDLAKAFSGALEKLDGTLEARVRAEAIRKGGSVVPPGVTLVRRAGDPEPAGEPLDPEALEVFSTEPTIR
jgi:hypothetical protein